jgi:hypothetical protein
MKVACSQCSEIFDIRIRTEDVKKWQSGALIQNVMPYLSDDQRELLISGTCGKCFDKIFDRKKESA